MQTKLKPRPVKLHGDPRTTGRRETASERKHRRRNESRRRARPKDTYILKGMRIWPIDQHGNKGEPIPFPEFDLSQITGAFESLGNAAGKTQEALDEFTAKQLFASEHGTTVADLEFDLTEELLQVLAEDNAGYVGEDEPVREPDGQCHAITKKDSRRCKNKTDDLFCKRHA